MSTINGGGSWGESTAGRRENRSMKRFTLTLKLIEESVDGRATQENVQSRSDSLMVEAKTIVEGKCRGEMSKVKEHTKTKAEAKCGRGRGTQMNINVWGR